MIVENADMLCTHEATDMNFERGMFYRYRNYIGQEFQKNCGPKKKKMNKVS